MDDWTGHAAAWASFRVDASRRLCLCSLLVAFVALCIASLLVNSNTIAVRACHALVEGEWRRSALVTAAEQSGRVPLSRSQEWVTHCRTGSTDCPCRCECVPLLESAMSQLALHCTGIALTAAADALPGDWIRMEGGDEKRREPLRTN